MNNYEDLGFPLCDSDILLTDKTRQSWQKARNALEKAGSLDGFNMDTVGAVSVNVSNECCAVQCFQIKPVEIGPEECPAILILFIFPTCY